MAKWQVQGLVGLVAAAQLVSSVANAAPGFSGGACATQGSWLQAALVQSEVVTNAIQNLRNDPNCQILVKVLETTPKLDHLEVADAETASFANTHQELKAIADYLAPNRMKGGLDNQRFREVVTNVVFNKSYESIRKIHEQADLASYSKEQRDDIQNVSLRLKSFLKKTRDVAEVAMATTRNILNALPQSKLCMDNKPSQTAAIFGALANSVAAVVTGGQITGVGELLGSMMQFNRDMKYIKAFLPIELTNYQNAVSCLIESTSEAYCSVQDAENTLDYLSGTNLATQRKEKIREVVANVAKDPVANSLGGLVILMRDVPIMQAWMQKVLFGIDPRLSIEATMKNNYWASYLGFVQQINSILGNFRDKEQLFIETTQGKSYNTKVSQVKEIYEKSISDIDGTAYSKGGGENLNFFNRTMQWELINFYLLGFDSYPPDFIELQKGNSTGFSNQFENWWTMQVNGKKGIFANPDDMIHMIRARLSSLLEKAQVEANAFFAKRMVVDPQNLLSEAMKGPGVTPLQAFTNLRNYYKNLADKLQEGAAILKAQNSDQDLRSVELLGQIPLLQNSIARIDKIIAAIKSVAKFDSSDYAVAKTQSEDVMSIIYEAAYMLVARDSFFGTRMQTALHADLSDTLWRKQGLNAKQLEYFMNIAPEVVSTLAGFYNSNPILQRADVSAAKMVHIANLKSVETLFSKVVFNQILDLDCKLFGGEFCKYKNVEFGSGSNSAEAVNEKLKSEYDRLTSGSKSMFSGWFGGDDAKPTEDSASHHYLRAKLCVQALAFESRDHFKNICKNTELVSEFSDKSDANELNLSFDKQLDVIAKLKADPNSKNKIDGARSLGVCSLRSYVRKNHIFYMFQDYMNKE